MFEWSTAASAATAAGTLVLAVATFSAVRSANRSARATETALHAGIRPVLMAARLEDEPQKVHFADGHYVVVQGGRAVVESTAEAIYLVMAVRNVGNGLAVLDRWELVPERLLTERTASETSGFRRLTRDIYVPAGGLGFWQGAVREPTDPLFSGIREAVAERRIMTLDVLYGDHEGGQRTITRFTLWPADDGQWLATVGRHWNLDRPDPR
jgi:hypothetical protein